MKKNSKIFIAGNGLVGKALYKILLEKGYSRITTVSKAKLDLRNQKDVNDWFQANTPEYVLNAAAKVGGINYNALAPADFIYDNLLIQSNLIYSSFKNYVKKFLFLGSACVYPKITPQPIKEEYLLTSELEPTNEGYALAKIAGLKMCQFYKKQYGFNSICLMPANLYGPNDNFDIEKGHVIPGMIQKFYNAQRKNIDYVTAWGDGSPTREFLYAEDLADACLFLMLNYNDSEIINVGNNVEISIKDLLEIIKKEMKYEGKIYWDKSLPNGTPRRKLDNTKLFNMGWSSKTSLESGLHLTVKWFKENKI